MSSPDALASVTATLKSLLNGLVDDESNVTTMPPSTARIGRESDQINIFLYGTYYNTAFNNSPLPHTVKNGEKAYPPLPLVLKYLITTYGAGDNDILGQQLMGKAMSVLHDHPVLGRSVISDVVPDSGLHEQIERVRITPDTLSLDDMSKLWASFQSAEYRLSTGYEVSVVLIESNRSSNAPLPVLKRGEDNQGVDVVPEPAATLSGLRFPNLKPSAELADPVTLLGENLTSENAVVRFQHPQLDDAIDISPEPTQTKNEMVVQLPIIADEPGVVSQWPAGFYTLTLVTQRPDKPVWTSNAISLPLSPSITSIDPVSEAAGDVLLTITCMPQILADQQVVLLFSDRMIKPDGPIVIPANSEDPTTLTFMIENAIARAEPYVLRLRVDGVDSIPVDFSGDTPQFADNQKVTIT